MERARRGRGAGAARARGGAGGAGGYLARSGADLARTSSVETWMTLHLPYISPTSPLYLPYISRTSSVDTWMKRLRPAWFLAASMSTCEPITLFSVKANELPNELSTCVCHAGRGRRRRRVRRGVRTAGVGNTAWRAP